MRKLALYCGQAGRHYAAAQQAIHQVGMTKGFKRGDKSVAGDLDPDARGIFGEGAFNAAWDDGGYVVVETWVETCHMLYCFSWPGLKLVKMQLDRCACPKPGK